jgi:acetyl esterase/lipase
MDQVAHMVEDARELLDADFAARLDGFSVDFNGQRSLSEMRIPMPGLGSTDAVERSDHAVPGDPDVPIRIHRPRGASGPLPAVFSIHGGGYVLGDFNMDDERFEAWCPGLRVAGVSVDYRLAPQSSYPDPLEDCYRSIKWTFENADELGLDGSRLGVYGVSAGGGLAAALALLVRDREELPLAFQLLESPMLDDRQRTPSSNLNGLAVFGKDANEFCWRAYLGERYGSADVSYYAAPSRAVNL